MLQPSYSFGRGLSFLVFGFVVGLLTFKVILNDSLVKDVLPNFPATELVFATALLFLFADFFNQRREYNNKRKERDQRRKDLQYSLEILRKDETKNN